MPHTSRNVQIRNVKAGQDVVIYEPANVYDCILGDDVFVGPFVEIQANTSIGRGTKIQSHTFICEYVTVGENCFIGHGAMATGVVAIKKAAFAAFQISELMTANYLASASGSA